MIKLLRNILFTVLLITASTLGVVSQDLSAAEAADPEYIEVLKGRSEKIVAKLDVNEPSKQRKVRDVIVMQYYNLSRIHDGRDTAIEKLEEQDDLSEKQLGRRIERVKKSAGKDIKKLHKKYIAQLSDLITADQVDRVKDGMTYGVLPLTYNAYLALLPNLTDEQKEKIKQYLTEAREIAMDAGSSERKHYWFGQYKGKINNFLSAAGYDLKQAEKEMLERRNAKK